jgi:hypothetical protein
LRGVGAASVFASELLRECSGQHRRQGGNRIGAAPQFANQLVELQLGEEVDEELHVLQVESCHDSAGIYHGWPTRARAIQEDFAGCSPDLLPTVENG